MRSNEGMPRGPLFLQSFSVLSLSSFPNIHRPKLQGNLARKAINQEERRREEKKACLV